MNKLGSQRRGVIRMIAGACIGTLCSVSASGTQKDKRVTVNGSGRSFAEALNAAVKKCYGHEKHFEGSIAWRLKEVLGETAAGTGNEKITVVLEIM